LTHETLKDLGVTSVGHRVKLLDAIAALRNDTSGQSPSVTIAPPSFATLTAAPVAEAVGERRHLTVMFCDLVGSTSISAALDAEDWRDLVGAYLDAASAAVTEMGGHVAKRLGDGLMALFGYDSVEKVAVYRCASSPAYPSMASDHTCERRRRIHCLCHFEGLRGAPPAIRKYRWHHE
jgi:class 3 adenylate cyclase